MNNLFKELKPLDDLLTFISNSTNYFTSIDALKNSKLLDLDRLNLLENEGLILKSGIPVGYKLTMKGMVFIRKGGYTQETKKKNIDRVSNLFYLLSSPTIAFISLIISIIALSFSITTKSNPKDIPLNYSSEIKITLPEIKDTVINNKITILPK